MSTDKYADIIHLPHHVSEKRAPMSMVDRGAQFSPFAALTGYDAVVQEAGRLTDADIELAEDSISQLDRQLRWLAGQYMPMAEVTWFCPDDKKQGGSYRSSVGHVVKIDKFTRILTMEDGTMIPLDSIYCINCE